MKIICIIVLILMLVSLVSASSSEKITVSVFVKEKSPEINMLSLDNTNTITEINNTSLNNTKNTEGYKKDYTNFLVSSFNSILNKIKKLLS